MKDRTDKCQLVQKSISLLFILLIRNLWFYKKTKSALASLTILSINNSKNPQ